MKIRYLYCLDCKGHMHEPKVRREEAFQLWCPWCGGPMEMYQNSTSAYWELHEVDPEAHERLL